MKALVVLNSPVFLIIAGFLCLLGLLVVVQTFRKGLSGFDRLAFGLANHRLEDSQKSLASKQFRNLLFQTIAAPILTCIILVCTFIYQVNSVQKLNSWVAISDTVLVSVARLHRVIIETESNLRGYLLTSKVTFADQYEESLAVAPKMFSELQGFVAGSSSQTDKIAKIKTTFDQWVTSAQKAKVRRNENLVSLSADVVERRLIMNEIKLHLEDFETTEIEMRAQHLQATQAGATSSLLVIITLSIGAGLFLSLAGGQQLRRLSGNYGALVNNLDAANQDLENKVMNRTVELRATNKELEAFCYSVSHDLRAPLRGIDGFSQILIEEYRSKIDESGVKYLNYIRQGVQKMGILIDDLLNLSRLTRVELKFKDFDLSQMAREIFGALLALEPERKAELKAPQSLMVNGDPGLIRVAMENLLSNALKYSSKNKNTTIEFGATDSDHGIAYYVRDNGVGFDMKYYDKLFQAFQRLHDNTNYKGTGIGLATVKRVIARHGGEIWADSKPQVSTTFYFTLKGKA